METENGSQMKLTKMSKIGPKDDSLNDNRDQYIGRYSRDSFDRFGDDLCELLLSYLTFKEKIIFENVSKQWKRCVYTKQRSLRVFSVHPIEPIPHLTNVYLNELLVPIVVKNFVSGYANNMNMRTINKIAVKSLLIKCPFIRKIELTRCFVDRSLLDLFGTYCPHLESIQFDLIGLEEEDLVDFGQKYGERLKQIRFNVRNFFSRDYANRFCNEFGKKLLTYCSNIKSFVCEDITIIADRDANFLPKLESVELRLRRNDYQAFAQFVDKYELKMKKIRIYSYELDVQNLRNVLSQIARFRNIEDLNMSFSLMTSNNNYLNDKVVELTKNCTKLKRLAFSINTSFTGNEVVFGNIFDLFGKFVNLRILCVSFQKTEVRETVESLKRLKQLTHLTVRCSKVGDSFFRDIDLYLPNLRSLQVCTDFDLTDTIMDSISKLRNLSKLSLGSSAKALKFITDSGVSKLINSCNKMNSITFFSRPNITTITIDNLIALAKKKPKTMISFFCGFSRLGDEANFAQIDMNKFNNIPVNLKITIRTGQVNNNPHFFQDFPPNVHVIEFNLNANHNPPPIHFQELHQILIQQHGFVQNILNNI